MLKEDLRTLLSDISLLLANGGQAREASVVRTALSGSDAGLEAFLVSNELWGGSGSIADGCFASDKDCRSKLEVLLIQLGELQIEAGRTNVRTAGWVAAFENWRRAGLRQT